MAYAPPQAQMTPPPCASESSVSSASISTALMTPPLPREGFFLSSGGPDMGRRATKRRQAGQFNADSYEEEKVRSLFPGTSWSPDDKEPMRDQSYTKNVKPRSKIRPSLWNPLIPTIW